ncbi:hypothetical protein RFI_26446 [Reticulomyxa filosa]|uniref:Uncharacterized protein n=1 Tax=Reticulomyxa filosa TaxID=46433 RepID=X6MAR0_RETFI|nr:hypothetical protein RFI_26446 [Reticulomyxa filosa]|eukprot:ETO10929.1 hypothetical protein RFI_26446 [Reticulomyxa filosa]
MIKFAQLTEAALTPENVLLTLIQIKQVPLTFFLSLCNTAQEIDFYAATADSEKFSGSLIFFFFFESLSFLTKNKCMLFFFFVMKKKKKSGRVIMRKDLYSQLKKFSEVVDRTALHPEWSHILNRLLRDYKRFLFCSFRLHFRQKQANK